MVLAKANIQQHYWQHLRGHREQLIMSLHENFTDKGFPMSIAMKVAIKELANYESTLCNAELDIDRSSTSLIVIHDLKITFDSFYHTGCSQLCKCINDQKHRLTKNYEPHYFN